MRDQHDGVSLVGELAQEEHHLAIQAGIKARGWLIQEEDAGVGQQFQGDGDALALPARELADQQRAARRHLYVFQHFVDALLDLGFGEVAGQAQFGGIVEGALNGQVAVNDIILWHIAKLRAEGGQVFVIVLPVIEDRSRSAGRRPLRASIRVDLPAPEPPTSATNLRGGMASEMSLIRTVRLSPAGEEYSKDPVARCR